MEQTELYKWQWDGRNILSRVGTANEATLYTDNDFTGGNNGKNNIEQAWYGLFELFCGTTRRTDLSWNSNDEFSRQKPK